MAKTQAELLGERLVASMGSMTPAELARRAKLNRQQVHRYLNGKALPRADSFMRICQALALDPWTAIEDDRPALSRQERFDADLFGNAKNPSVDQFPSGVYELFSGNPLQFGSITRLILHVSNDGASCRVRATLPKEALPAGAPYAFRRMSGILKVKFEQSYYMTFQNRAIQNADERLVVTVMVGPEEPSRRVRQGITMRLVPFPGASSLASKVTLRRLDAGSYRKARKQPALLKLADAPKFVRDYFLLWSKHPYHFGPAADADTSQQEIKAVERDAPGEHANALTTIDALQVAVGNCKYPSEADFESGVYDLFVAVEAETPELLNIPLLVGGDTEEGRWVFSRLPTHFYPYPVPKGIRDLRGPIAIKRDYVIHLFGVIKSRDRMDDLSHYYRFGAPDFKSGARFGFVVEPDLSIQAPIAARAALVRSSEQNFRRAFRRTTTLSVEDAPASVKSYFQKQEQLPYLLSTSTKPKIF